MLLSSHLLTRWWWETAPARDFPGTCLHRLHLNLRLLFCGSFPVHLEQRSFLSHSTLVYFRIPLSKLWFIDRPRLNSLFRSTNHDQRAPESVWKHVSLRVTHYPNPSQQTFSPRFSPASTRASTPLSLVRSIPVSNKLPAGSAFRHAFVHAS